MTLVVKSLSIEVEHAAGSGTIVLRDPLGDLPGAYVAGQLPIEAAEEALAALGIVAPALFSAGGMQRDVGPVPSRPGLIRALEAPLSRPSTPRSNSGRYQGPAMLSDLLEELAQAVLRTGRQNPTTTVDELLESAWLASSAYAPIARLLARLEASLAAEAPAAEAALTLAALSELVARLRDPNDALHAELNGRAPSRPLDPCELVELGRRRERGTLRTETRVLIDLASGELLSETDGSPGARLSRGPVGRHLSVMFGRRFRCAGSPRVEIQHYEYDPAPSVEQLERVSALASSGVSAPAPSGLSLIAMPEPILVQLKSLGERGKRAVCLNGTELELHDGTCPGATAALLDLGQQGERVDVLLGTLELLPRASSKSSLVLVPWSAIVENDGQRRLVSLSF